MTEPLELTALPETVEVCPGRSYERSIRKPRRSVDHNKDIRQYTDKMASTHVEINGLGAQIWGTGRDAFRQVSDLRAYPYGNRKAGLKMGNASSALRRFDAYLRPRRIAPRDVLTKRPIPPSANGLGCGAADNRSYSRSNFCPNEA
jgi:hypothetical protein